jgi:hypothetical protein
MHVIQINFDRPLSEKGILLYIHGLSTDFRHREHTVLSVLVLRFARVSRYVLNIFTGIHDDNL